MTEDCTRKQPGDQEVAVVTDFTITTMPLSLETPAIEQKRLGKPQQDVSMRDVGHMYAERAYFQRKSIEEISHSKLLCSNGCDSFLSVALLLPSTVGSVDERKYNIYGYM